MTRLAFLGLVGAVGFGLASTAHAQAQTSDTPPLPGSSAAAGAQAADTTANNSLAVDNPARVNPQTPSQSSTPPATQAPPPVGLGFDFGSYGRVGLGSDLRGHEGYGSDVVSHGTRLELAPYIELNFYYTGKIGDDPSRRWRVVLVPAFAGGNLFHYSGDLVNHITVRNAYAEVENLGAKGLTLWLGSRMYRGDDIYQFNYWPLDNLNTVGAGVLYAHKRTTVAFHVGLNRLDDSYQYQTLDTPPRGLGTPGSATVLDRPRLVMSFKLTQGFWREGSSRGAKIAVYGEFHALPGGDETDPTTRILTPLPRDFGWVAGLQLGGWLRPNVFLNAWLRTAGGLAAYGELTAPQGIDRQFTVTKALEVVGALAGNFESKYFGMMFSTYARRFVDGAGGDFNPRSYTEGIVAVRPTVYLGKYFHFAAELSFQGRKQDGVDPYANRVLAGKVFRASFMPIVSPTGRGTYARPNLYLVYTVSRLNDDARETLYDSIDFRSAYPTTHYFGGGVEWWFNSSYR